MDFPRICARLDPKCFKAFLAVVAEGSFSAAAPRAAMTTSGVSQHVTNLEEAVGHSLFMRTASGCKLTDQGYRFNRFIKSYSDLLADLFEDLTELRDTLQGVVRYAMPPSCLLSPHFPMLLERRLAHPDLELSVELIPNADIFARLYAGQIDFGFVTEKVDSPVLAYREFCREEYILVGRAAHLVDAIAMDNFIHQRFIVYPGFDVYANLFAQHFFTDLKDVDARSLYHVSGRINTIDGGIKMVAGGLGVSIFPRHCVQHLLDSGQLCEYRPPGDPQPLLNTIYIVHHLSPAMPRRVATVINWFMDMMH